MPQASDKDRDEYSARFGSIDCNAAVAELKARGYTLTKEWDWIKPETHTPTGEEMFWMGFLVYEWDFGWLVASPEETR